MGGIHHQIEALPGKQFRHLLPGQPFGGNGEILRRGEQSLTVFRSHAGSDFQVLPGEKFHQTPSLGGSGENTQLTHGGILWGSPAPRR